MGSDKNNIRTQVQEHMQGYSTKLLLILFRRIKTSKNFATQLKILHLWFLRLKIAYENKQILDLLYVLAGCAYFLIFYFMLSVHVFETKMKNSDNSKYLDEIDEAVEINQSLRLLFIVFTGL